MPPMIGPLDAERVEERGDVVGVAVHRDGRRAERRAAAEAAQVGSDHARGAGERAPLRRPERAVGGETVEEDERRPRPRIVVREGRRRHPLSPPPAGGVHVRPAERVLHVEHAHRHDDRGEQRHGDEQPGEAEDHRHQRLRDDRQRGRDVQACPSSGPG